MINEENSGGGVQQQSPQLGRFLQGAAAGLSYVKAQAAQLQRQVANGLVSHGAQFLAYVKSPKARKDLGRLVYNVLGLAFAGGVCTTTVTPNIGNQPPEAIGRAVAQNTIEFPMKIAIPFIQGATFENTIVFAKDKAIPFIVGAAQETQEQVGVVLKSLDEFMRSR